MATVRFSKELIDRIVAKARSNMAPAVTKAEESKPDNSWGQRIYDTMFLEAKPFIAQAPAGWLKMVDRMDIEQVGDARCNMRFTFSPSVPWPNVFVTTATAKKERSYSDGIVLTDEHVWAELYAEVVAYNQRVDAAKQRQADFVNMVSKVCDAYSTLAPALKAWPPLWDLIPDDVKDKHREIKERTKNEVVLDVDIGKLTAMSTAAKFGI
jgi:metal-sulfur cluster biosynthetic enzyme